jgi:hypothetical protein
MTREPKSLHVWLTASLMANVVGAACVIALAGDLNDARSAVRGDARAGDIVRLRADAVSAGSEAYSCADPADAAAVEVPLAPPPGAGLTSALYARELSPAMRGSQQHAIEPIGEL